MRCYILKSFALSIRKLTLYQKKNYQPQISFSAHEIRLLGNQALNIMARVGTLLVVLQNGDLLSIDQH